MVQGRCWVIDAADLGQRRCWGTGTVDVAGGRGACWKSLGVLEEMGKLLGFWGGGAWQSLDSPWCAGFAEGLTYL